MKRNRNTPYYFKQQLQKLGACDDGIGWFDDVGRGERKGKNPRLLDMVDSIRKDVLIGLDTLPKSQFISYFDWKIPASIRYLKWLLNREIFEPKRWRDKSAHTPQALRGRLRRYSAQKIIERVMGYRRHP